MKRSLQEIAVEQAFKSLPLKAQRALLPELTNSARIVTNYAIPECSEKMAKFTKWLLSSPDYDSWSEEQITEAWELFNFIYQRVLYGGSDTYTDGTNWWFVDCDTYYDDNLPYFKDSKCNVVSRDEYFAEVIKHQSNELKIDADHQYDFDELIQEYSYVERMELLKKWNHISETKTSDHLWE